MDLTIPRRVSRSAVLVAAAWLLASAPAGAWSPKFHEQVAEQSARLMPRSLRSILARHKVRLTEGARAPLAVLDHESRYYHAGGSYGTLDEAILKQTQRVLDLLGGRADMDSVAYEMGVLSSLVALAHDPTHLAADDPREAQWAPTFQHYAERKLDRYRVVFDGYLSEELARDDVRGFVRASTARMRHYYPILARSFVKDDGSVRTAASFDDRHPVYGVASLAYARSISDTAKLWLYAWIRSNGDTSDLPFPQGFHAPIVVQGTGQ